MADLSKLEQIKFERLFHMETGFVLDFSNKTFEDFFLETAKIDIYHQKYSKSGTSKAKRLRTFWTAESNFLVGKVLLKLLEYWKDSNRLKDLTQNEKDDYDLCFEVAKRLSEGSNIENQDVIIPLEGDNSYELLIKNIHDSFNNNEPEAALDRLHTYLVKYIRGLCEKHGIVVQMNMPLHSIFGMYIKGLQNDNYIETEMTLRILKSSISLFESFNDIRNNRSLAHDNEIINKRESILIINNVTSIIKFINSVEDERCLQDQKKSDTLNFDEIPF